VGVQVGGRVVADAVEDVTRRILFGDDVNDKQRKTYTSVVIQV
jgi:hypothetical protein